MTTILFEHDKFWIDGVEIINPELLPLYFNNGLFYYTQKSSIYFESGDTFPLPENLNYEMVLGFTKNYIKLKLEDDREYPITDYAMKNETPVNMSQGKDDCQPMKMEFMIDAKDVPAFNKQLDSMLGINETPEAVVEKPDFVALAERLWEEDQKTNPSSVNPHAFVYGAKCVGNHLHHHFIKPLNSKMQSLQKENKELAKIVLVERSELISKISDLEAQLVKAKGIIDNTLCSHEQYGYLTNDIVKEIESFLSTNEVK